MQHRNFTGQLLLWTFGMMLVIGCIQVILGVFKIYHPEKVAFESTSIHTISTPKTASAKNLLMMLEHRHERIQIYIDTLPEKKREKMIQNINTFLDQYDPQEKIDRFTFIAVNKTPTIPIQKEITPRPAKKTHPSWHPHIIHQPDPDRSMQTYEQNIVDVFLLSFIQSVLWKIDVFIDHDRIHPRGQMKDESVILSSQIQSYDELVKVLVHELAHVYDIYFLKGSITKKDPSYDYYEISWQDVKSQRPGSKGEDFISGYAATNQYEDFAEAFTYYLFHSKDFKEKSQDNPLLKEKYSFLKDNVFQSFFQNTSYESEAIPEYIWDTTKVPLKSNAREYLFGK